MNVNQMVTLVNNLSDEQESNDVILEYLNDAIATINIKLKANLPFLQNSNDVPVFNETWQRTLLVPFAVGRIKQQDSSQFEYTDAYSEFQNNLIEFALQFNVPDIYKDEEDEYNTSIRPGLYENKPYGWSF